MAINKYLITTILTHNDYVLFQKCYILINLFLPTLTLAMAMQIIPANIY